VPRTTASYSRVRDRTDELELFISGLLAFALLAVPGYGAAGRQIQGNHQQKTGDRVVERRCERVYR
jgi:hypothetical protein